MTAGNKYEVDLPAGGALALHSAEEQDLWETTKDNYQREYNFTKPNDLVLLGSILTQQLLMFRQAQRLNGMIPQLDAAGIPKGTYKYEELKPSEAKACQTMISQASSEIRDLEKSLGIDKKTRESGGMHTLAGYLENLKLSANQYGAHISKRVIAYEQFAMDLRWRLRLLRNGDEEDKAYHGISEAKLIEWAEGELAGLEEVDRTYAKDRGRLWLGKL